MLQIYYSLYLFLELCTKLQDGVTHGTTICCTMSHFTLSSLNVISKHKYKAMLK